MVGTHEIVFSDNVRINLGFILDSNLTLKQHIKICQTACYELKRISSIRMYQFPIQLSPPGQAGFPATICIYVVGLLPVELYVLFYFGPPKINGSNSKISLLWLHNLEKEEKNYEDR